MTTRIRTESLATKGLITGNFVGKTRTSAVSPVRWPVLRPSEASAFVDTCRHFDTLTDSEATTRAVR
jgi:hypothetical protein